MLKYLSYTLKNDLRCYNNERNIHIVPYKNNEVSLTLNGHCGTHIDFPFHADNNGRKSEDYDAEDFNFKCCYVKEIKSAGNYIESTGLKNIPFDVDFLIFKTGFSENRYTDSYVLNNTGISLSVAQYLRENFKNLRCIGIDSISINAYQDKDPGRLAHCEFLCNKPEILIIEDMDLTRVGEGIIEKIIIAPLLIENADGVPVTVIADV